MPWNEYFYDWEGVGWGRVKGDGHDVRASYIVIV